MDCFRGLARPQQLGELDGHWRKPELKEALFCREGSFVVELKSMHVSNP
jgi:hypothetical protein